MDDTLSLIMFVPSEFIKFDDIKYPSKIVTKYIVGIVNFLMFDFIKK